MLALGVHPAWWLVVVLGLLGVARSTWQLRTRSVLAISDQGFEVSSGWRRVAIAWTECTSFTATAAGTVQVGVMPDLGLKPPPPQAIRAGLDHRPADDLVRLLTSYLPSRPTP